MRPILTPRIPPRGAPLFLALLYIGSFSLGQFLTGSVFGGIVTALTAPGCTLVALSLLLPKARIRSDPAA